MSKRARGVRCLRTNRYGPIPFWENFLENAKICGKFPIYSFVRCPKDKEGKLDRNNTYPFWVPSIGGMPFRISEYSFYQSDADDEKKVVKILESFDMFSLSEDSGEGTPVEFSPVYNPETVLWIGNELYHGNFYTSSPWTKESVQALKKFIIYNGLNKYFEDDDPLNGVGYWYVVKLDGFTCKIVYSEGELMFNTWLGLDVAGDVLRSSLALMKPGVAVNIQNIVLGSLMDEEGKLTGKVEW